MKIFLSLKELFRRRHHVVSHSTVRTSNNLCSNAFTGGIINCETGGRKVWDWYVVTDNVA